MTPPDSGEREVCSGSGYTAADRQGSYMSSTVSSTVPVEGKCGICGSVVRIDSEGHCATHPFPSEGPCRAKTTAWCPVHGALIRPDHRHGDPVSISLSLAQRILAALEDSLYGRPIGFLRAEALRDELRAAMPGAGGRKT